MVIAPSETSHGLSYIFKLLLGLVLFSRGVYGLNQCNNYLQIHQRSHQVFDSCFTIRGFFSIHGIFSYFSQHILGVGGGAVSAPPTPPCRLHWHEPPQPSVFRQEGCIPIEVCGAS
jgi:hypothetical protein